MPDLRREGYHGQGPLAEATRDTEGRCQHFLVESIHDEYQTYQKLKQKSPTTPPPDSLLELLRLLSHQLDVLEADREAWWTSPEKRALRQRLEHECDQRKLSDLHKISK